VRIAQEAGREIAIACQGELLLQMRKPRNDLRSPLFTSNRSAYMARSLSSLSESYDECITTS
jgi:hypothetical protein